MRMTFFIMNILTKWQPFTKPFCIFVNTWHFLLLERENRNKRKGKMCAPCVIGAALWRVTHTPLVRLGRTGPSGWPGVGEGESPEASAGHSVCFSGVRGRLLCPSEKVDRSALQVCFFIGKSESLGSNGLAGDTVFWDWAYTCSRLDSWVDPFKPCMQCLNLFRNAPGLTF